MSDDDIVICPKCKQEKRKREFRIRDTRVRTCRACRARVAAKLQYRDKKDNQKLQEQIAKRGRQLKLQAENKGARDVTLQERELKKRFLQETRSARTCIKRMEKVQNPKQKTINALSARNIELAACIQDYEQQLERMRDGQEVPTIRDMIHARKCMAV